MDITRNFIVFILFDWEKLFILTMIYFISVDHTSCLTRLKVKRMVLWSNKIIDYYE